MPRPFVFGVLSAALLLHCALAGAQTQARRGDEQILTNASVIKLVRGGFSDKAVVAIINSRPTRFDLSTERLIELKKNRVSERVILAMVGREGGETFTAADDDDWDMGPDPFFKDSARGGKAGAGPDPQAGAGSDPGEINIFGSGGGSRGRVRSRGQNGGVENDTETVGSASVRILRPPTEAGGRGAAAKLERTPTLTNESVVQLVDAGFSDGTIIRRIEQSPVEFDLSDAKLAELRKRRVGEPVIAAMRSAMSGDADREARPGSAP